MAADPIDAITPRPDPTALTTAQFALTTAQLQKESEHLKEFLNSRIDNVVKDIAFLQVEVDRRPVAMQEAISQLTTLQDVKLNSLASQMDTRFLGVQTQFSERDKHVDKMDVADKTAIAAALMAQKELQGAYNDMNVNAAVKMESNFSKLIDQGNALMVEMRRNTEVQIADIKSRLDKGEGHSKGLGDGWGYIVGAIGALMGVAGFVALMIHAFKP